MSDFDRDLSEHRVKKARQTVRKLQTPSVAEKMTEVAQTQRKGESLPLRVVLSRGIYLATKTARLVQRNNFDL